MKIDRGTGEEDYGSNPWHTHVVGVTFFFSCPDRKRCIDSGQLDTSSPMTLAV